MPKGDRKYPVPPYAVTTFGVLETGLVTFSRRRSTARTIARNRKDLHVVAVAKDGRMLATFHELSPEVSRSYFRAKLATFYVPRKLVRIRYLMS